MQDWLSGKTGKINHYAEEQREREETDVYEGDTSAKLYRWLFETWANDPEDFWKTPYNESYEHPVGLGLLHSCLMQMALTNKPLPRHLTELLVDDVALLISHRDGKLLRREKKRKGDHPDAAFFHEDVVYYVMVAKAVGFDDDPMKTIKDELGIGRSTYYKWASKAVLPHFLMKTEVVTKEQVQELWDKILSRCKPPE